MLNRFVQPYFTMKNNLCFVACWRTIQYYFINDLHSQRSDEKSSGGIGRYHCMVLFVIIRDCYWHISSFQKKMIIQQSTVNSQQIIILVIFLQITYFITIAGKINSNISKHATNCTISSELRFCPDIAIRTILFFLILQIKCRYWWMMAALFSNITHSAFRCIYNTWKCFSDNGIVGLLASMDFVMPTW